ncbi:putative monovalent cation/H+ antiporter subunit F [Streptomyces sp. ADI96-02]|uniref:monovalent cation/H+ antiporter complex subunit F n=1 Tax=unclassified Streptomyces TaxID=2593676 RepID=UPI000F553F0D|nr:monovalent cation/H+ antiporter complex subunit F [Streptomyces sp. ADI96-02]RPK56791.1 putative monovalent cation/H+ antiporter subunit F [Streptomyces sp. ADI96-02]
MSAPQQVDRILLTTAVVLLLLAGTLLLARIWRGPSMLDRAISLDVLAALIIAGLAAKSAFARDAFYFPIMLVLAFLGFTGSVGIARFIAVRDRPRPAPRPGHPGGGAEGPR